MRKLFVLICLLVLGTAGSARGATYYIDQSATDDSANGTTKTTPWKRCPGMVGFVGAYAHAAGDIFVFKGGETWVAAELPLTAANNGTDGHIDQYTVDATWYSGASYAAPIFDAADTDTQCIVVMGSGGATRRYITINGLELKRATGRGILADASTGAVHYLTLTNLYSHSCGTSGITVVNYTETYAMSNITISDCILNDNGNIGLSVSGAISTVSVARVTADGDGVLADLGEAAAGLYFGGRNQSVAAAWATGAAPVYSRVITVESALYKTVYAVINTTDGRILVQDEDVDQTVPEAGEWGIDGTTLYVRLHADANPNGKTLRYCYGWMTGVTVTDCTTSNTELHSATGEGHGLDFDDFSHGITVSNHTSHTSAGANYDFTYAFGCVLQNSIAYSNHTNNIHGIKLGYYGKDNKILNCVIYDSDGDGIEINNPQLDAVITNNIIINSDGYGIDSDNIDTGYVENPTISYNCVYGNGTAAFDSEVDAVDTNSVLLDPLFTDAATSDFTLQPLSPCINTGTDLTASGVTDDILGTARPQAGLYDIGAYEEIFSGGELDPGADTTTTLAIVTSGSWMTIDNTGIVLQNCTIVGPVNITEDVSAWNTIFAGPVIITSGDTLSSFNCSFAQSEATIEALGGAVVH